MPIRTVPTRELILAGLSSQVVAMIGAAIGLLPYLFPSLDFLSQIFLMPFDHVDETLSKWTNYQPDGIVGFVLNENFGKALLFIGGGLMMSVGSYLLLWHGFRLERSEDALTWNYGLLTKRTGGVPRKRIQLLKIEQPLLRRFLGLATLKVDTAGDQAESQEDKSGRGVLMPILPEQELASLCHEVFPDAHVEQRAWKKLSPLAIRRGNHQRLPVLSAVSSNGCSQRRLVRLLGPLARNGDDLPDQSQSLPVHRIQR